MNSIGISVVVVVVVFLSSSFASEETLEKRWTLDELKQQEQEKKWRAMELGYRGEGVTKPQIEDHYGKNWRMEDFQFCYKGTRANGGGGSYIDPHDYKKNYYFDLYTCRPGNTFDECTTNYVSFKYGVCGFWDATAYAWCETGRGKWHYCCTGPCGKHDGKTYEWCYTGKKGDTSNWNYCDSRITPSG